MNSQVSIPPGFTIVKRCPGIIQKYGKSAGQELNWYYEVLDSSRNECILMFCNPGEYTIIDKNVLPRISEINDKKVSWFIMNTGYVGACITENEIRKNICLHQHLMNHRGHGQGQDSVDHINRNKLDNRLANLRIASQSEQNENTGKRTRKYNAKPLPDGIRHEDLPKYVVYYNEKHGEGRREFFTIEKHPIQKLKEQGVEDVRTDQLKSARWISSKSKDMPIQDKLGQAREYLAFLDELMYI
ncbi:MAG: hypothetical protein EBT86_01365 [Actinobacteria bacterium]|nr:hypothetical protein [Actinomycetota bacterium]